MRSYNYHEPSPLFKLLASFKFIMLKFDKIGRSKYNLENLRRKIDDINMNYKPYNNTVF